MNDEELVQIEERLKHIYATPDGVNAIDICENDVPRLIAYIRASWKSNNEIGVIFDSLGNSASEEDLLTITPAMLRINFDKLLSEYRDAFKQGVQALKDDRLSETEAQANVDKRMKQLMQFLSMFHNRIEFK